MNYLTNLIVSFLKQCLCQTASESAEFKELHCEPLVSHLNL